MKLAEILNEEQLDEISFKQAVAAGLIGAATLIPAKIGQQQTDQPRPPVVQQAKVTHESLAAGIARRYKIAFADALEIVKTASAKAKPTFPKTEDILAVIGIESSFDKTKKSQLRHDPAVGLMQVRPGVWGISPKQLKTIDAQLSVGVDILSKYYDKLGDVDAALNAYNVGITNHKRGVVNPRYAPKFHKEKIALAKLASLPLKKNS